MNNELKTGRVEALCDGIFAIAMTLLIVGFGDMAQWAGVLSEDQLCKLLLSMWPDFAYYVQSFIILGAFWVEHHHQFHYIKHTDLKLLFINIFAFIFVALIPVSTLIVGDYGHTKIAAFLFEANLLLAGLCFYFHWRYASGKSGMIDREIDRKTIQFYNRKNLVIPAVSVIAILITFLSPQVGSSIYFIVPFIIAMQKGKN